MSERELARLRDEVARRRLDRQKRAHLEALAPRSPGSPGHLTIKQLTTARKWADGYTYKEIAAAEGVGVSAIAARVNAAKYKFGLLDTGGREQNRRRMRDALRGDEDRHQTREAA